MIGGVVVVGTFNGRLCAGGLHTRKNDLRPKGRGMTMRRLRSICRSDDFVSQLYARSLSLRSVFAIPQPEQMIAVNDAMEEYIT